MPSRREVLIGGVSFVAAPLLASLATSAHAAETDPPVDNSPISAWADGASSATAGYGKKREIEGNMEIKRSGSQPSGKGPAEYFTGTVRVDPLFDAPGPARVLGASVTFEPAARTAWHTHPLGQTLIVMAGCGRVQRWGGPIEEIRPGDVVWILPAEKHWHGAAPTTAMTHIAIVEKLDGKSADWMEKVSDEQYQSSI